jgi:hypothetical protein
VLALTTLTLAQSQKTKDIKLPEMMTSSTMIRPDQQTPGAESRGLLKKMGKKLLKKLKKIRIPQPQQQPYVPYYPPQQQSQHLLILSKSFKYLCKLLNVCLSIAGYGGGGGYSAPPPYRR